MQSEARVYLGRLAAELERRQWPVNLSGGDERPVLTVANPGAPGLSDRIFCRDSAEGWRFCWHSAGPIGSVEKILEAADLIIHVLRVVDAEDVEQ
jgi:hypothetical protein